MVRKNLIVLLTDFGLEDNYAGVMKGVIKSINPNADIVDLNHNIEPQNIKQALFCLYSAYKFFPEGTIFVCVVDPGVGSKRKIILVKAKKYYFLAPDNGILSEIIRNGKPDKIIWVKNKKYFLNSVSNTFHGRDIFSPVSAYLSLGTDIREFGPIIKNVKRIEFTKPVLKNNKLFGEIVFIDHFGNLITDIDEETLKKFVKKHSPIFVIKSKKIHNLNTCYESVSVRKPLAIIGSSGHLEISVSKGSAKKYFSVQIGDKIYVKKY